MKWQLMLSAHGSLSVTQVMPSEGESHTHPSHFGLSSRSCSDGKHFSVISLKQRMNAGNGILQVGENVKSSQGWTARP